MIFCRFWRLFPRVSFVDRDAVVAFQVILFDDISLVSFDGGFDRDFVSGVHVVMHDHMKDIQSFMKYFPKAKDLECWWHIIDNIYRHLGGTKGLGIKLLWAVRKEETFQEWEKHFNVVVDISEKTSRYINNNISWERNFNHKILEESIRSHNRTTSQTSEGQSFQTLRNFRNFTHCTLVIN